MTSEKEDLFDLDQVRAAKAEKEGAPKPKRFKVGGKKYDLPPDLPASFVLLYANMAGLGEIEQAVAGADAITLMLGPDYEKILGKVGVTELPVVMNGIMGIYGMDPGKLQEELASSAQTSAK